MKIKMFKKIMIYLILSVFCLALIVPFLWMVSSSFKSFEFIYEFPPRFIPRHPTLNNFKQIFIEQPNLPLYYWNSFYISFLVVGGTVFFSTFAGYAFAKIDFPFRNVLFLILLIGVMIPGEATAISMYRWMSRLNLLDSHFPLIVPPMLGSTFGIFLMRQFYLSIPKELIEAAKIDGCNQLFVMIKIMLPLSKTPMASLAILTFLGSWNEFFTPLLYLNSSRLYTIPLAISMFTDTMGTSWNLVMALTTLTTLPLIIAFFFAQKQFIESIAFGGIKG